jgi:UDPglucose 6-dehydrogenase
VIRQLLLRGAHVVVHDPVAMEAARSVLLEDLADVDPQLSRVDFAGDLLAALRGADALIVLTEWKLYHNPDFDLIREELKHAMIFDGRNIYDPARLQALGIGYQGVGRRNALGECQVPASLPASGSNQHSDVVVVEEEAPQAA